MFEFDIEWRRVLSLQGRIGRGSYFRLIWLPLLAIVIPTWWRLLDVSSWGEAYDTVFFGGFAFSVVLAFFSVRRLHDLGKPGWWSLILVAPFALAFVVWVPVLSILSNLILLWPLIVLVFLLIVGSTDGDRGPNAYGWPGSGSPFPAERRAGRPEAPGDRRHS